MMEGLPHQLVSFKHAWPDEQRDEVLVPFDQDIEELPRIIRTVRT